MPEYPQTLLIAVDAEDQISKLYESGADTKSIATGLGISEKQVIAALYERSPKFRRAQATQVKSGLPIEDEMLEIIVTIARTSEDEWVKLAAARNVRADLKGRLDEIPVDHTAQNKVIDFLNASLKAAEASRLEFMKRPESVTVDV